MRDLVHEIPLGTHQLHWTRGLAGVSNDNEQKVSTYIGQNQSQSSEHH